MILDIGIMKTIHGKYMTDKKVKTPKKEPEHKDIIGRTINVGDFVSVVVHNSLHVAKVIKLNPKMVKVKILNAKTNNWYNGEHNKYSYDMVLIDNEYLTMYLLRSSA